MDEAYRNKHKKMMADIALRREHRELRVAIIGAWDAMDELKKASDPFSLKHNAQVLIMNIDILKKEALQPYYEWFLEDTETFVIDVRKSPLITKEHVKCLMPRYILK